MNRDSLRPIGTPKSSSLEAPLDPANAVSAALHHRELVKGLAWHLVREPADADELEQETWLAALERPPRSKAAIRSWLSSTLRKVRGKRIRTEVRRRAREEAVASCDPAPSTEELVLRIELEQRVVKAVTELSEPYRTTILLRFYEDLSAKEISERLGISYTAVRARLWRGMQQLREALDETHPGGRTQWRAGLIAACGIDLGAPPPGGPPEFGGYEATETIRTATEGISLMSTPLIGTAAIAACAATVFLVTSNQDDPAKSTSHEVAVLEVGVEIPTRSVPDDMSSDQPGATRSAVVASTNEGDSDADKGAKHGPPGTLLFRAVDATTGKPIPSFTARFMSDTRFAQNHEPGAVVSSMSWDLAIRARGYEPTVLSNIDVLPGETTDLGEIRIAPGRGTIEGVVRADWAALPGGVTVELQGSVPVESTEEPVVVEGRRAYEEFAVDNSAGSFKGVVTNSYVTELPEVEVGEEVIFDDITLGEEDYTHALNQFRFESETGILRQHVGAKDQGHFEFQGLPAGDYRIMIKNPQSGLHVSHPVTLRTGGHDHSIHTAPGTTDLDLVLVNQNGSPYDISRLTDEDWPEVWVDVQANGRSIGSAEYVGDFHIFEEVFEDSEAEIGFLVPKSIDRERQDGDSLLPPLRFNNSHHDFTGERVGGNVYPLSGLPNEALRLQVSTGFGTGSVEVDLRRGSPGRVVVTVMDSADDN